MLIALCPSGCTPEALDEIRSQLTPRMPHSSPKPDAPHPSRWIQDFLNTTLGINRRKREPDGKDDGKHDPDPVSGSGQIQLWQVIVEPQTAR